jgi:hypothetical protein
MAAGGAPPKAINKGSKRSAKGSKKGQKWHSKQVVVITSCDNDNDKEVDGSDKEHVATTK